MAQVSQDQVPSLAMGFFTLLIGTALALGLLNHYADR